jgi:hypothetical protein
VGKELYQQLAATGVPMELIANDHRRYFIKTP